MESISAVLKLQEKHLKRRNVEFILVDIWCKNTPEATMVCVPLTLCKWLPNICFFCCSDTICWSASEAEATLSSQTEDFLPLISSHCVGTHSFTSLVKFVVSLIYSDLLNQWVRVEKLKGLLLPTSDIARNINSPWSLHQPPNLWMLLCLFDMRQIGPKDGSVR